VGFQFRRCVLYGETRRFQRRALHTIASGLTGTSFSDNTVSSGTTYYYVVSAVDSGGEGLNSAEAMATTQPAAPTGLSASASSVNQID